MSFFDWLAGNTQTQEEAQANLDRQKALLAAQMNQRIANDPTYTTARQTRDQAALGTNADSVKNGYLSGFAEGLNDGKNNVNSAFWSGIGNALKLVPTPVWIAGGAALFLYLGGGAMILKKTKGVLAK